MTGPAGDATSLDRVLTDVAAADDVLDKLHAFIARRISDVPDAESVYWETVMAFTECVIRKGCPAADYPKLLFGIAHKKVADYWREARRRRHSVLVEPSDLQLLIHERSSPYESVDERVDVARAVAEADLDDDMRQVLALICVDRLSQEEAAAVMGQHRSRIRRLLARTCERILETGRLDTYASGVAIASGQGASEARA